MTESSTTTKSQVPPLVAELLRRNEAEIADLVGKYCEFLRETAAKAAGKPRRPSIKDMIKGAEQAGRPLASITLPDGTKLDFDKAESTEPENPWLADLRKETKQ